MAEGFGKSSRRDVLAILLSLVAVGGAVAQAGGVKRTTPSERPSPKPVKDPAGYALYDEKTRAYCRKAASEARARLARNEEPNLGNVCTDDLEELEPKAEAFYAKQGRKGGQ